MYGLPKGVPEKYLRVQRNEKERELRHMTVIYVKSEKIDEESDKNILHDNLLFHIFDS